MTPERKAELEAELDEILGPATPKPKVSPRAKVVVGLGQPKVVADDGVVIRDVNVMVSPADPNAQRGSATAGVVRVRRSPPAESPLALMLRVEAERQWWDREAKRQRQRMLDPVGLGHWGPRDE
jgi:hypothetical protein